MTFEKYCNISFCFNNHGNIICQKTNMITYFELSTYVSNLTDIWKNCKKVTSILKEIFTKNSIFCNHGNTVEIKNINQVICLYHQLPSNTTIRSVPWISNHLGNINWQYSSSSDKLFTISQNVRKSFMYHYWNILINQVSFFHYCENWVNSVMDIFFLKYV